MFINEEFSLHGIRFEWDEQKAVANRVKHWVSFESAAEVFFDPMILSVEDEVVDGELREHVIGMTNYWRVLYMIYSLRDETIRVISARQAEPHERRIYENQ